MLFLKLFLLFIGYTRDLKFRKNCTLSSTIRDDKKIKKTMNLKGNGKVAYVQCTLYGTPQLARC